MMTNDDMATPKNADQLKIKNICICGKNYTHRQGLSHHKKHCLIIAAKNNSNKDELIDYLMKENSDLKTMVLDVCKQIQPSNSITNSNINSNNKTFNLNVFLNEQCKDAINISDFVNSLVVNVDDLEETAQLGYTEGISKIFLDGLLNMNTHSRPIHCSDSKREILYIKDQDKWEKDNETNDKITKAIKSVAHKNMKVIPEWVKQHPDYNDANSKTNDKYLKIVMNSMSGSTEEEQKRNVNKIISNIAKETIIIKP